MTFIKKAIFLLLLASLLIPAASFAQPNLTGNLNLAGKEAYGTARVRQPIEIIELVIRIFLSFLGIIMLVLILYAGYLWMTAGGNDDQVGQAKQYIQNAVIGTVIILSAYGLSVFVINMLQRAATSNSSSGGSQVLFEDNSAEKAFQPTIRSIEISN